MRQACRITLGVLVALLFGFAEARASHVPDWSGTIRPGLAPDFNPDPRVVEVVLVAHPALVDFGGGAATRVWTYNGGVPGPTIQARLGDTLIVHFFNLLPEATTIHWHGVEVPAHMDGSQIAQNPVEPGRYFRYQFRLLRAATFWYHPHVRSNEQVEKGLYGMLVVRDPAEDGRLGLPAREHLLVLDDILLDESGQVAEFAPEDPLANAARQVNGREGNTLLTNGRTGAVGSIRRGVPHRLRIVNTSNTRFMRISIPGHRLWRIGGDAGLRETPVEAQPIGLVPDPDDPTRTISDPDPSKGVLLTPGERAEVVFTPRGPSDLRLEWHDIPRGLHSTFFTPMGTIGLGDSEEDGKRPSGVLLTLRLFGRDPGMGEYIPPSLLRTAVRISPPASDPIPVTFGHTPPDAQGDITFFVARKDGMPLPFPLVTPADAPTVNVGDAKVIEVVNLTGGDHNFHLHGFMFQLIETQFVDMDNPENNRVVPATSVENKDTILLPRRPGAPMRSRSVTRLAVLIDDTGREGQVFASRKVPGRDTSGGWVFHCHLLEHADRGMMSFLQVVP